MATEQQQLPEYAIEIRVSRKMPREDSAEQMARVRHTEFAPNLEVALPLLNAGINEQFDKLIQMATIAEDGEDELHTSN